MPGQGGLTNILASSGGGELENALSLQSLYPSAQSPMSFKQLQKAKRQKRVNASLVGNAQGTSDTAPTYPTHSRQSSNPSNLNANASPL